MIFDIDNLFQFTTRHFLILLPDYCRDAIYMHIFTKHPSPPGPGENVPSLPRKCWGSSN